MVASLIIGFYNVDALHLALVDGPQAYEHFRQMFYNAAT
jgi:hypothetical protein